MFEEKFGMIPMNKVTKMIYRELLKEYAECNFLALTKNGRATASVEKLQHCLREAIKDAFHEAIIHKDLSICPSLKDLRKQN